MDYEWMGLRYGWELGNGCMYNPPFSFLFLAIKFNRSSLTSVILKKKNIITSSRIK